MQKKTSFTLQEAQKKLEYYCAYQERCHWEVEQKLKDLQMIPEAQEVIISKLIEAFPEKCFLFPSFELISIMDDILPP